VGGTTGIGPRWRPRPLAYELRGSFALMGLNPYETIPKAPLQSGDREDLARKVSAAQEMLGRVIHTTDNLDEKVGRTFSSMSFLAVGATIVYTSFISDKLFFRVGGVDLVSVLFACFMIFVAATTALMLEAMGPRFHLNPFGRETQRSEASKPAPTGYADKVASMDEKEWTEYFASVQLDELYTKWYAEAMEEVYVLSKKVDRKVGEMRNAQRTFLISIVFLVLMVILGASAFF